MKEVNVRFGDLGAVSGDENPAADSAAALGTTELAQIAAKPQGGFVTGRFVPGGTFPPHLTRLGELCQQALNSLDSVNSKRNYRLAMEEFITFWSAEAVPLSRGLVLEYRRQLTEDRGLSAVTVNVRLSAVRKLVDEAWRSGWIDTETATEVREVKNVRQLGQPTGNWLTREQAKEILTVPDRSQMKGKRDYVILAMLVGCALRRSEMISLTIAHIQQREGRWVILDLVGKGGRKRTVAIPRWVKQGIDEWIVAAGISDGRLLRAVNKSGRVGGQGLSDWTVWSVVEAAAAELGIDNFGAHDLRRTCAKLCRDRGGKLEQIQRLLGHASILTTDRYLGTTQELTVAVNDNLGLE